ncbi:hypothetical protein LIER_00828 [Lithospermum erythrorhizon]|uniref:BZIP domain-containing protein n=1 Tax=Lithospermum erythrorhizon TaxID=34254 RepID=A0AAV3NNJ6_LITER
MDNELVDISISAPMMAVDLDVSNHDDISRRIKNRERQRRYRARKRLLTDLRKAKAIDISAPPSTNLPYDQTPQHFVTRVLCRRDWKKDARRAHLLREEETGSNTPSFPETVLTNEGQTSPALAGCTYNQLCSSGNLHDETRKHIPSRRQWKVDARNKKS